MFNIDPFVLFQALASAIASTKVMKAQQVVKSESGEEVKVTVSSDSDSWLSFMASRLGVFLEKYMPTLQLIALEIWTDEL